MYYLLKWDWLVGAGWLRKWNIPKYLNDRAYEGELGRCSYSLLLDSFFL